MQKDVNAFNSHLMFTWISPQGPTYGVLACFHPLVSVQQPQVNYSISYDNNIPSLFSFFLFHADCWGNTLLLCLIVCMLVFQVKQGDTCQPKALVSGLYP
jgi:hypothetical protein